MRPAKGQDRSCDGAEHASAHALSNTQRTPWKARRRSGVVVALEGHTTPLVGELSTRRLKMLGLRGSPRSEIDIERWPPEPASPPWVDLRTYERAFVQLCPPDADASKVAHYARAALQAAAEYGVDPFLLAALSSHQSGCHDDTEDSWGIGLTRVNLGMHQMFLRGRTYQYASHRKKDAPHAVPFPYARKLTRAGLRHAELNLRATAALLHMFQDACTESDELFHSTRHRHPVSHVIFGDRVRSALPEAQILTERRRVLSYYEQEARGAVPELASAVNSSSCLSSTCSSNQRADESRVPRIAPQTGDMAAARRTQCYLQPSSDPLVRLGTLAVSSPLDGAPRIATGLLGDSRDHGHRIHNGIDVPSAIGEPVRAIADGTVEFSGVELDGENFINLAPGYGRRLPSGRIGPRGIHVRIQHAGAIHSLYVHLGEVFVATGEHVRRGQQLGTVGLIGVRTSDPHLHFGLFEGEAVLDPLHQLAPYLISNPVPEEAQPHRLVRAPRRAYPL